MEKDTHATLKKCLNVIVPILRNTFLTILAIILAYVETYLSSKYGKFMAWQWWHGKVCSVVGNLVKLHPSLSVDTLSRCAPFISPFAFNGEGSRPNGLVDRSILKIEVSHW